MSDRHAVPGKLQVPPGELRRAVHELGGVAEHLGSGMASLDRFVTGVVGGSLVGGCVSGMRCGLAPMARRGVKNRGWSDDDVGLVGRRAAARFVHSDHTGAAGIRRAVDT